MGTSAWLSAILERRLGVYVLGLILMRRGLLGGERLLIFLWGNQHVAQSQCQKLTVRLGTEHASQHEHVPRQDR